MQAGDTLFVRGGIYSNQGFTVPANAGTPTSPLRITAYPGEVPVLTGNEPYAVVAAIYSSAIIDGLHFENFTNVTNAVDIWGNYVTVQNCTFKNVPFQFIRVMGADHVTIQNNYLDGNGQLQQTGLGDAIYVGSGTHVLVQNNYDTRAGHYFFDAMALPGESPSSQVVVRDNTVESFWGGGIGHGSAQNLVYENNRLSHVGEGVPYIKASFEIGGMDAIVRYNLLTNEAGWYSDNVLDIVAEDNGGPQDALHNRIYNNVFFKNGYMPVFLSQRYERNLSDNKISNNIFYYDNTAGQTFYGSSGTTYIGVETYHAYPECPNGSPNCTNYAWTHFPNGNYFQNNLILHADSNGDHPGVAQIDYTGNAYLAGWRLGNFSDSVSQAQNSYASYISGNIERNPSFINPDNGDFSLQAGSPAIGAGEHLAHVAVPATQTSRIIVDDPYYFTDGFGLVPGDVIIAGRNSPVRISAVDYANRALTLSAPVTVAAGDDVDLADHHGSAPDLGAFEYSASAPMISGVSASAASATNATVTWTTSTQSTSQVEYGTTTTYGQTSLADPNLDDSHSVELAGLWPNTIYHYAVISTDSSGGRAVSEDGTFTTPAEPGPTISNVLVSNVSPTAVLVSWTTSTASSSQVFFSGPDLIYTWNPGYVHASARADESGAINHSVALSGLLPNTMYHFAVQSTDGTGLTSHSADSTFTTQSLPSAGPAISDIKIQASAGPVGWFAGTPSQNFAPSGMNCCGYSYAQATFSWVTSVPTTKNKVMLIPTIGGGYIQSAELDNSAAVPVAGNPEPTTTPSVTVFQLAPNTTYVYIVQSTDAEGHSTSSPNYEFTTPSTAPPSDGSVAPPSQPSAPTNNSSSAVALVAKHSGKCLTVPSGTEGAILIQKTCSGSPNQQWLVNSAGSGTDQISSVSTGMALNLMNGSWWNGVPVIQWSYSGTANERWRLTRTSDGYYQIVSVSSGLSLDVTGGPSAVQDGAPLEQWSYWGGDNQKFSMVPVP
ncbi:MAG TPA: RICIN domain-containing protein [Bryobacteraceae bacterium]|nr:RICIN domain-containing protein [Bryobacteraceae bacterium]